MFKLRNAVVLVALALAAASSPALGWIRPRYEDVEVMERSKLIVLATIKEGSVTVVEHKRPAGDGRSHETRATLVIREVLKGELKEKELPIVIRYGLDIVVDKKFTSSSPENPEVSVPVAKERMELVDTGGSPSSFGGNMDLRQEQIWCLRRGGERAQPDDTGFGITDPEDLQPAQLRQYLMSYLEKEPEPGVRESMRARPELAERATRYLLHRQVQKIMQEQDPAVRVEKLLPFYTSSVTWGYKSEARAAIAATGEVAGPYLLGIFNEPGSRQEDIIDLLGEIRYAKCEALLTAMLNMENDWWRAMAPKLQQGWWNQNVDSRETQSLRDHFSRTTHIVKTLGLVNAKGARPQIEKMRKTWEGIAFEPRYILEQCDRALQLFDVGK